MVPSDMQEGTFVRERIGEPLEMEVAGGAPVSAVVTEAQVFAAAGAAPRAMLHLEVDLKTFQRIEDDELFDYSMGSIAPSSTLYKLTDNRPVTLRLCASGGVDPEAEPQAILDAIVAAVTEGKGALAQTASDRLWEVLQQIPSRPGVMALRGYRSVFAAAAEQHRR